MMEADLIARLLADGRVSDLLENRINPVSRIEGENLPALTVTKVSPGRDYTFKGPIGQQSTLMQFDAWALTPLQAKNVISAVMSVLEAPAQHGWTDFGMSFLQSERDGHEDVLGIGTVFRVSADFLIWWKPVT